MADYEKIYQGVHKLGLKGLFKVMLDDIQEIGQMVILRSLISQELELKSRINSTKLYQGVNTMNKSILNDYFNLDKPSPDQEEDFCDMLVKFSEI